MSLRIRLHNIRPGFSLFYFLTTTTPKLQLLEDDPNQDDISKSFGWEDQVQKVPNGRSEETISLPTRYRRSKGNQEVSNFHRDTYSQVDVSTSGQGGNAKRMYGTWNRV